MNKEFLYKEMQIDIEDIEKGENLLRSYSLEMRAKFLLDIYAEYQSSGFFKSLKYIYGHYPNFRKVQLINIAISGSDDEKNRLAWGLSNPYDNEGIEDLYVLTYEWINYTENSKVFENLSRGLMFYIDKEEVQDFFELHIEKNIEFVKGVVSWLYIQPEWFRENHRDKEMKIWKDVKDKHEDKIFDDLKVREINKKLGLKIDSNEIWLHEIDNPWNFSSSVIDRLIREGVNIKIDGSISEFAMGSPLITSLILNNKKIKKFVGGPFITDKDQKFLCCTTFSSGEGFRLVLIELETNKVIELDSSKEFYTPYKYDNGDFVIILGDGKIDLEKSSIKYNSKEIKNYSQQ